MGKLEPSSARAQRLREAPLQRAILLRAITVLALLPVLCKTGFASGASLTVTVSTTSLFFGYVTVGMTTAPRTVTLKNSSNAALTLQGIAITGANATDFAQSNNCGNSLGIGASCIFSVTMTPSAAGKRHATLAISDNVPGGGQSVFLMGIGVAPAVNLSPASLFFGTRAIGTTSAAQAISVTNGGPGVLVITSLAITGADASDFAQTNNCGNSVPPTRSCTIGVTFTPVASGSRVAAVSITDNAAGASGGTQTVSLSGTGAGTRSGGPGSGNPPAGVSLSPATLTFATQPIATTSTTKTITLSNGTGAVLSIAGLAITGTNAADFAEIANTCGACVAAGGTCTIGVSFTPSGSGQRTATLNITDNASGSPQAVSLTGNGCADIILSWTPSATPGIVGYNIYRGVASGGEGAAPINSAPVNADTYVDSNVTAGTTYYYVLTSVAAGGEQSPRSNETEATLPTL